ncbi:hypothetical protein BCR44DRAFT_39022, partial [Catenaria anguillulae PL171]
MSLGTHSGRPFSVEDRESRDRDPFLPLWAEGGLAVPFCSKLIASRCCQLATLSLGLLHLYGHACTAGQRNQVATQGVACPLPNSLDNGARSVDGMDQNETQPGTLHVQNEWTRGSFESAGIIDAVR